MREERTAIVFGCQNRSPIENDIDLVRICRQLAHGNWLRFFRESFSPQGS